MALLTSFSTLNQRVIRYQSDYGLETVGDAFVAVGLEAVLNLNEEEIIEATVDDGSDGGIDAIHIQAEDVHIFTHTYTKLFKNASKNFPQSKLDSLIRNTWVRQM